MAHHNLMSIKAFCEVGMHIHNRQACTAMVNHSAGLEHDARLKASWQAIVNIDLRHGLRTLQTNKSMNRKRKTETVRQMRGHAHTTRSCI